MSVQVAYFALLLPLTFYLVFLGYKIADGGLDALERGRHIRGAGGFWSGIALACGSAVLLPPFGYWLAFNDGFGGLLSRAP